MRQKVKQLIGILLSVAMMLGMMLGMSLTAYAATDTYTKLMNDKTVVKFNNHDWYIIADDSTATGGTVTLLAADTSFGISKFHDSSNAYSTSTVKGVLDALTAEGGAFAAVKDAIADTDLTDVGVSGAKLYLLSTSEAGPYANFNFTGVDFGVWWLRSPGSMGDHDRAAFVDGVYGIVNGSGGGVDVAIGVRPALKLNLSSVIFSSESMTFSLKQEAVLKTAPVAKNLTYDGSARGLVTTGEATGGEMQYALGENETTAPEASAYSASIPTATDAGTYYIWYKVVGDEKHKDTTPVPVTASIARKALTITAKDQTYPYNGNIQGEGDTVYTEVGQIKEKVDVKGLVGNDALTSIILDGQANDIGVYNNCIIPSSAAIGDHTANYDITYISGTLTIKSPYSWEWVKGKWYEKDGSQTYEPTGSWKKDGTDWMYVDDSGWCAKNRWQKIDGKWYFFDRKGHMVKDVYQKGVTGRIWYVTKNGTWDENDALIGWKKDANGWWFALYGNDYLKSTWKMINGDWYYFKANGYIAMNEFVQGYWINENGTWKDKVLYSWHKSGGKWWYGVEGGWYAKNGSYIIDGKEYTFDKKGYCVNP